jgi:hypothetical protein
MGRFLPTPEGGGFRAAEFGDFRQVHSLTNSHFFGQSIRFLSNSCELLYNLLQP